MKNFWKKTGWFMMCVLMIVISLVLQVGFGIIALLPSAVKVGIEATGAGITDMATIQKMMMEYANDAASWGMFAYHIISLPIFGLWFYFLSGKRKPGNPVKVLGARGFGTSIVAGSGFCLIANGMLLISMFAAPVLYERYVQMAEAAGLGVHPAVIFASIVLAPIGEELLCRGIIFNYAGMVTKGMKNKEAEFWVANAIQALMFGIMHANWIQGSFAFVIGLGLGWMRRHYNSLYPSMLAHLTVNFLSSFVMGYVFLILPENLFSGFLLVILGCVVAGLAARLCGLAQVSQEKAEE